MTIFEGMLLAHLLGDWILQSEWQARNKGSSWPALLVHIFIYHVIMFWVLAYCYALPLIPVSVSVAFLAVTHIILDRQKFVRWFVRAMRMCVERDPERWFLVAVDQAIHLLLMGGVAIYLTHLPG